MTLKFNKKGFTLIELLIVIAILGILAVGLLAALDPLEQTRRASDTSKRQLAVDLMGALDRFYTQRLYPAWCADTTCAAPTLAANTAVAVSALNAGIGTNLNTYGESKSATAFSGHPQAANVIVSRNAANNVTICWMPESKAQKGNSETKWTTNLGAAATCAVTTSSTCFQCIKN